MSVAQKDRGMLARIGFFLCRDGEVPDAEDIFTGLAASAPEKDGPVIGLALCRTLMGETEEAVSMLDARIAAGTSLEAEMLTYKVLALGMAGRMDEAKAVKDEMEGKGLAAAVKTAEALLDDLASMEGK